MRAASAPPRGWAPVRELRKGSRPAEFGGAARRGLSATHFQEPGRYRFELTSAALWLSFMRLFLSLALFLAALGPAVAQTPDSLRSPAPAADGLQSRPAPRGRPTVGLVLSGGAAKGLAHVGALREIEAAGIPIDVVTGTSMGAIVGGLYAMGIPVDSLEALVVGRNLTALFTGGVDRGSTPPEVRLGEGAALVSVPIEGRTLGLPSGLIAGQGVFDFLAAQMWPAAEIRDFTTLPRPFAAIATDAATGGAVRLTSGNLPLAIRASMSLPSLFAPVEIDGKSYLDGGLARNLPAEDARALGADVLVCVDVSDPGANSIEEAPSFFDILVNAAFYQSDRDLAEQRALCDVLIIPNTDGISAAGFNLGEDWIARGLAAAQAQRPALDSLAARLGHPALDPPPRPRDSLQRAEAVTIRGISGAAERLVRRTLGLDLPRDLAAADVEAAVQRVVATGQFELITYRLAAAGEDGAAVQAGRSVPTLVFDVAESNGNRVGFGFRYDTEYNAALLFTVTLRDLVQFGSRTKIVARLGEQTRIQATTFGRLGFDRPIAITAQAGYTDVPVPLFAGVSRDVASGRLGVLAARAFAGPVVQDALVTGLGASGVYVRASPDVAPDSVQAQTWTYAAVSAYARADSRDRTAFPSRGVRFDATADLAPGLGASFQHVAVDAEAFLPLARGLSVSARVVATRAWGSDVPFDQQTFLGGVVVPVLLPGRFFPLLGTDALELSGRAGQLASVSAQITLRPTLFLLATANAGRAGEAWTLDPSQFKAGGGLTLGAATPVGALGLTLAAGGFQTPAVTFSLGREF